MRVVSLVIAVLATIVSVPHLAALLVPAYPTSFYRSETGGTQAAITAGRALFAANCVSCHGASGRGDGPLARSLPVPPADLTQEHLLEHADGELFWWISHGIDRGSGPDGAAQQAMPGFGGMLNERSIWQLIDFIRANNPHFLSFDRNRTSSGAPHAHTN